MTIGQSQANGGGGAGRPSRILPVLLEALDRLTRLAYQISAALLGMIVVIYCTEIVMRYFFLSPTIWARDTVTYMLCAMLFLAAPEVARTNSHIAVTLLLEGLTEPARGRAERVLWIASAVVTLGVAGITLTEVMRLYDRNILTLGTVALPKWWFAVFIPLGFGLVGLQFLSLTIAPERHRAKDLKV